MKIELIAYTITWTLSCWMIYFNYKSYRAKYYAFESNSFYRRKISNITIFLVAIIWVCFNIYITTIHPVISDDWVNYQVTFSGQRQTPSLGLAFMMDLVKNVGGDLYSLSRLSTFICMILTLIAYRYSEDASPLSFVFLFLTEYAYLTISLLKQTFTNAIASLFFIVAIQYNNKRSNILCAALILLACLFHPVGFVLIPLFIILRIPKTKWSISIYILIILFIAIFFNPLMVTGGRLLTPIAPAIGLKITQYFNESSRIDAETSLAFIKSLPELCIVLLGFYKRKTLRNKIEHYDEYLIIATTGEFLYLMSAYSVWLYRMIYLFHFTIFVFFDSILRNLTLGSNKKIITLFVSLMLGIIMYRFLYISF